MRGGEHGSFMRGHKAGRSMKGCLLGVNARCVTHVRHSAREVCSTLPARPANLRSVLGPLRACTCCAQTLYAFCIGPGWEPADGACAGSHLVGSAVPCRRQPEKVHAHGRLSAILCEGPKLVPVGPPTYISGPHIETIPPPLQIIINVKFLSVSRFLCS